MTFGYILAWNEAGHEIVQILIFSKMMTCEVLIAMSVSGIKFWIIHLTQKESNK